MVFLSSAIIAQNQSQSVTNQYTKEYILQNAQIVTTKELYADKSISVGQPVKLKGEILQTDSNYVRVKGININSGYNLNNNDIIVFGNFENIKVYEKDEVWVYGTYYGPYTYETVLKSKRTVPAITSAWVEPTGNSFN